MNFLLKIEYNYTLGRLSDNNNIFNLICIQITGQNARSLLLNKIAHFGLLASHLRERHLLA